MRRIMIHRDKPACARLTQQRTRVSTRLHNCDRWSLDFHNTPANRPGKQHRSSNLIFFQNTHSVKKLLDYSIKIISIFHKYIVDFEILNVLYIADATKTFFYIFI